MREDKRALNFLVQQREARDSGPKQKNKKKKKTNKRKKQNKYWQKVGWRATNIKLV